MKDVFGKELHVGDEVVYLRKVNRYTTTPEKCKVVGFTDIRVLLNTCDGRISPDRLIRIGSGMTGAEMLAELGYIETVPWIFVSQGYDSPTSHEINIQSNGDVKYITRDAFCGASYVMLPPDEIHAMHYWLEERGL